MFGSVGTLIAGGISDGVDFVAGLPADVYDELGPAAAKKLVDLVNDLGDLPVEVGQFANDPKGYVIEQVQDHVSDLVRDAASAALGGDIGKQVLGEIGLRPLVEGVTEVVNQVAEIVDEILEWVHCGEKMAENSQAFWALTGILFGARVSGLISRKEDCDWILESGQLADLASSVPAVSQIRPLFECAVKVAFELPLPEPKPAIRVPDLETPGTLPIEGVFARMQAGREHDEQVLLGWQAADIAPKLTEMAREGWQIAQISSYMHLGLPLFNVVLERRPGDQEIFMLRSAEDFQNAVSSMFKLGYVCTGLASLLPGHLQSPTHLEVGRLYLSGVFERRPAGQAPEITDLIAAGQGEALQVSIDSNDLRGRLHSMIQDGYMPQFILPECETVVDTARRVNRLDGETYVGQKITYTVLARRGPVLGTHYDYAWDVQPFKQFVQKDAEQRNAGMALYSVGVIQDKDHELRVSAVWRRPRGRPQVATESASGVNRPHIAVEVPFPSEPVRRRSGPPGIAPKPAGVAGRELAFHGWPRGEFNVQLNRLIAQGWSVSMLSGYSF